MSRKDPENEKKAKCLHLLCAQISGQRPSNFAKVSCENFGKVLTWFGPGVDTKPGKGKHKNFLERVAHIASQPWFFGLIDNADLLLHDGQRPVYMIRLSNDPGFFTIHTKKMKTRIVYDAKTGYKPEKGNNIFQDLVEFAENHLKAYDPLSGSEFAKIFGDVGFERAGAYKTINNLISTDGAEELIQISQNPKQFN